MAYVVNYTTSGGNRLSSHSFSKKYKANSWKDDRNKKHPGSRATVVTAGKSMGAAKSKPKAKKKATKKKGRVGSAGSGLKKYNTFVKNDPAVKRSSTKIADLEKKLKAERKVKKAAKDKANKKYNK